MKTLTLTNIRKQIYKIFDHVIETGQPVFVKRKGHIIKIDLEKPMSRTQRLFSQPIRKNVVKGDPEELVHVQSWQWSEDK